MSGRPLTDVQERTLIALADADDRARTEWNRDGWQPVGYVMDRRSGPTLDRLEELGLIETHAALEREYPDWKRTRGTGARITEAGRALLNTMGD